MGLKVRVIPCLDVDAGRVVKGTKFKNLRDAGDPVELAALYDREGAVLLPASGALHALLGEECRAAGIPYV